jgi:hypothetical protein
LSASLSDPAKPVICHPSDVFGEVDVRKKQGISSQTLVTAIFWDAFGAGSAVTALLRSGFAESDVHVVGVLGGRAPDLTQFFLSMGITVVDATYYNSCFQDGAMLLIVRAQPPCDEQSALEVIRRHGGISPPSYELQTTTVQ